MKINELEKLLGLNKANIRYYESEGLIAPKRTENGYRDYTDDDARLLKKIIIYRKLGIPIAEIKAVLNNEKSLNDAAALSISNMKKDIDVQNRAIDICNEIINKNIIDSDFDVDYFWDEISSRENIGEEFIDIGNIDITPFKNRSLVKALVIILVVIFFAGIALATVFNFVFILDDNTDYTEKQNEIITSDAIDTVKVNEKQGLIYVFYNNATCINTYDFDGNFKWAISVPKTYTRGYCYFYLENDKIYIDNSDDVFIYDSVSGNYIERAYVDEVGLLEKRDRFDELHNEDIKVAKESGITFDIYNVYRQSEGEKIAVVDKPIYTFLQNDFIWYIISFLSGLGLAVIAFISKIKIVVTLKFNESELRKGAKINRNFYLVLTAIFILFAVLNALFAICKFSSIAIGIFPLTALLIITFIINDITKKRFNNSEYKYTRTMHHYLIIAYAVAFISVLFSMFFHNF